MWLQPTIALWIALLHIDALEGSTDGAIEERRFL